MQLIEIVQLALIGFAALILFLFFVSYFGYRRKKKNRGNSFSDNSTLIKSDFGSSEAITLEGKENIPEFPAQADKSQKYKVFNPNLSKTERESILIKKKHFPRTLFIKK